MKRTMIDPPSGWRYGFPKELTVTEDENINEWLVKNGYPQSMIDLFKGKLVCRMWYMDDDEGLGES